jgi:hypothetical protein
MENGENNIMPKLTCHCGCIEAEINVPIKN